MPKLELKVQGLVDPTPQPPLLKEYAREIIKPVASAELNVARGDQSEATLPLPDNSCVELRLANGVRLWTRADDLERDFGVVSTRAADDGAVKLPRALSFGRRSRSDESDAVIAGLKVFGVDFPGKAVDFIATRVERGLRDGGELCQCSPTSGAALAPASKLAGTGPTLVFLHGTASSTDGSFGGLWEAVGTNRILRLTNPGARINDLFETYEGRVLAFQHRTLTESPITNALALAEQLAKALDGGSELHFVSHSRGGLVGELMSRSGRVGAAPFDELDLRVFGDRPGDRDALVKLGRVLQDQRFRVTRFLRVACPAGGTTLADGRLDRYFSMLVNIVGKIPALAGNPLFEGLTSLLAAILKERTDPQSLPGLEAMMPISPLVKMINRRDIQVTTDLHVLGGDLAMSGFWSSLKALATDFYFRDDHDLVVNTPSMLRGAPRAKGVQYWIDTGGEVTHFNYFHRSDTASRLCDALLGKMADHFHTLGVKPFDVSSADYEKRAASEDQPIVFVVPGFMGSHLSVGGGRVWVDAAELAKGRFGLLENETATPDSLAGTYASLIKHLAATHEVVPFPTDWRRSFSHQADALAAAIEQRLDKAAKAGQPIRILAHSTGGLVVRAMIASKEGKDGKLSGADVWKRMCEHSGARVLLLGTPTLGAHAATALLTGRLPLSQQISLLDLGRSEGDVLQILAAFDGLLEWLPQECLEKAWWTQLKASDRSHRLDWPVPATDRLKAARIQRGKVSDVPFDRARTMYVAGIANETPAGFRRSDGEGARAFLTVTGNGDGLVSWNMGIPEELAATTRYADATHGGLVTQSELFPALVDLLTTGTTTRLPDRAPTRSAESAAESIAKPRPVSMIPNEEELIASALRYDVRTVARETKQKVAVSIVHGDLSRAKAPVLVGHYQHDMFVSAEDYLDRQLEGRLRELHLMDLYPGPIGTAVVVANEPGKHRVGVHPGAIVVGLGVVGELTPGSLLATLENGLTMYGSDRVGLERRKRQRDDGADAGSASPLIEIPVTALLIGSGEGGVALADALQAMLRAVHRANERLQLTRKDAPSGNAAHLSAFITRLQIYELFEDRAIEAVHALNQLSSSAEFRDAFTFEPLLVKGSDGRQRASFDERLAWWQRIRIVEQGSDTGIASGERALKFEALTDRARVDALLAGGQRKLVDAFVSRATATTTKDPALGRTLFEMVVPLGLKEQANDRRQLVLLLDPAAATIPWELMQDGFDRGAKPLSVQAGMIRQLLVSQGRERVRSGYESTALVIGDPPLTDTRFPRLSGAAREAEAVKLRLAGRYAVEDLIAARATPIAVLTALHQKPWRILHIASHGVFQFEVEPGAKPMSGVVLGDGVILQASDFNQMRFVPHLVFLNCCHLGKGTNTPVTTQFQRLAANVAEQFIRMGARAVVAAGWAVDDGAAELFADTFYSQMLDGAVFGDAVQQARLDVHDRYPSSNTWGAYQCYGDPAFSLDGGQPNARKRKMVSWRELSVQADAIAAWARSADGEAADVLKALETLVTDAVPAWLDEPRVCSSLGAAYGELKQFPNALRYYRRAVEAENAQAQLVSLEQLANLESRYAEHLARDESSRNDALAHLQNAETTLQSLIALLPTSERYSMLGGLYKRRAMIATDPVVRLSALAQMATAYGQSYDRKIEKQLNDSWYPLANCVAGKIAYSWQPNAAGALPGNPVDVDLAALRRTAKELEAATSFWELVFRTDVTLLEALFGWSFTEKDRVGVCSEYQDARRRGASAREMDSVIAQIRFLRSMADSEIDPRLVGINKELGALVESLRSGRS